MNLLVSFFKRNVRFQTIVLCVIVISGCQTMEKVTEIGTSIGVAAGVISDSQKDSIQKTTAAVGKTFQDITPEQEYYIGRAVGASIVSEYKALNLTKVNTYLNIVGQALAQESDLPETFGGYRFLALDSDEINAFAAPGGLIFVTRGLLACCKTEDALAAVLAHEIAHVQFRHGLQSIKKSRMTEALSTLAVEGVRTFAGSEIASLTDIFQDSISDITSALITGGYSRSFEREADKAAITILTRVGYNPAGLISMLEVMNERWKPDSGFSRTHPSPTDRIRDIRPELSRIGNLQQTGPRYARFKAALGEIQ